ncbi:No apical meristem (NAM) protein [Corchorus olitorius]|uniref:No apical meristem (NAM) protein n=1 Tax=Corchorus olitorius TaxID=93759 RepID=A0A1R3K9P8_9ROSI|nr:No apical meristem (NAM) protein [Corchorus olitorius]
MLPPGYVFDPSDKEIVTFYLPKLIEGNGSLDFLGYFKYLFKVCNVYSTAARPSLLLDFDMNNNNDMVPCLKGNQRFFFTKRDPIAQKNVNGKRPRRSLHNNDQGINQESGQHGFWKSSTGDKPIFDDHNGRQIVVGYVNMLNFYDCSSNNEASSSSSNNGIKKNRKDARKSSYIMYEYKLHKDGGEEADMFQRWVVCKIKDSLRGEEDQCEGIWLNRLFFSSFNGVETLPEAKNKQMMMQEEYYKLYSSRQQFLELQPQEVPLISNDEDRDRRICSEIRAILGVESDSDDETMTLEQALGEDIHNHMPNSLQPLTNSNLVEQQAKEDVLLPLPLNDENGLTKVDEYHSLMETKTKADDPPKEQQGSDLNMEECSSIEKGDWWNDYY